MTWKQFAEQYLYEHRFTCTGVKTIVGRAKEDENLALLKIRCDA